MRTAHGPPMIMRHPLRLNSHNSSAGCTRARVLPRATIGAQYFPNEINRILGAELFHNMPAVTFESSWAYAKNSRGCLVGHARRNLLQHLDFPAGEEAAARKGSPPD